LCDNNKFKHKEAVDSEEYRSCCEVPSETEEKTYNLKINKDITKL
jgi:protein tyrosine/serine phosphatase